MIGLYLDIVIPPFYYIYPSKECSESKIDLEVEDEFVLK